MIEKVKLLFKGHRDLILGFNTFLPKVRRRTRSRPPQNPFGSEAPALQPPARPLPALTRPLLALSRATRFS